MTKPRGNPNWRKGGPSPNPGGRPIGHAEVIELARAVRERVHSAYGVELSAEPRFVNCTLGPIGR